MTNPDSKPNGLPCEDHEVTYDTVQRYQARVDSFQRELDLTQRVLNSLQKSRDAAQSLLDSALRAYSHKGGKHDK